MCGIVSWIGIGEQGVGQTDKPRGEGVAVPGSVVDNGHLLLRDGNIGECDVFIDHVAIEKFAIGVRDVEVLVWDDLSRAGNGVRRAKRALAFRDDSTCGWVKAYEFVVDEPGVTAASIDNDLKGLFADSDWSEIDATALNCQ